MEGSISWDPPQTAGVLGNLFYQLVVINKNTDQVIVNTTTTLTTNILPFEPCQVYVGQVTAHVGNMAGGTVVQEHRTLTSESLANSLVRQYLCTYTCTNSEGAIYAIEKSP